MKDKEIKDLIEQWETRSKTADKLGNDAAGVKDWPTSQRCRIKAGVTRGMVAELKRTIRTTQQGAHIMKRLSEALTERGIAFGYPIEIKDHLGRLTYYEDSKGSWCKWEYDALGNETCYEDSYGFCCKREYDSNGKETYYENSEGVKRGTPRSAKTCEGKVIEVDGIKYKLTAQ